MGRGIILVNNIVKNIPRFRNIFEEHINFYGELLPHIFFAELTSVIIDLVDGEISGTEDVEMLMDNLEKELSFDDEESRNVIALSFIENLQGQGYLKGMKKLMGPRLRALAMETCGI
ncbi:DUF7674 family protein [Caulobacter sp. LARHSG274]